MQKGMIECRKIKALPTLLCRVAISYCPGLCPGLLEHFMQIWSDLNNAKFIGKHRRSAIYCKQASPFNISNCIKLVLRTTCWLQRVNNETHSTVYCYSTPHYWIFLHPWPSHRLIPVDVNGWICGYGGAPHSPSKNMSSCSYIMKWSSEGWFSLRKLCSAQHAITTLICVCIYEYGTGPLK